MRLEDVSSRWGEGVCLIFQVFPKHIGPHPHGKPCKMLWTYKMQWHTQDNLWASSRVNLPCRSVVKINTSIFFKLVCRYIKKELITRCSKSCMKIFWPATPPSGWSNLGGADPWSPAALDGVPIWMSLRVGGTEELCSPAFTGVITSDFAPDSTAQQL